MTQFTKYLIYIIIGVAIIGGGYYIFNTDSDTVSQSTLQESDMAELSMVAPAEMSAADLLLHYGEENNTTIEYTDYGGEMGLFIQSIDNVPSEENANTGAWWQFWVNGEYSAMGASSVMLKTGDEVVWRYRDSQQ